MDRVQRSQGISFGERFLWGFGGLAALSLANIVYEMNKEKDYAIPTDIPVYLLITPNLEESQQAGLVKIVSE